MGYTKSTKANDIEREWHLVDVKDKVLGRVSTEIAQLLIGKSKPYFVNHLDVGDWVVVINASEVAITGGKAEKKEYTRYSGYPGGLKRERFKDLQKRKPEEIIKLSVSGMLPKNKLRKKRMRRLFVYAGKEHPYEKELKTQSSKFKSKS
jgi:large subunit ribosomal protein L13